jgi:hypothetical protein
LVLAHGFFGAGSTFTAFFIAGSTIALLIAGRLKDRLVTACDLLFCALLVCIGISFATNGNTSSSKEIALLVISLAAYPAGRLIPEQCDFRLLVATTSVVVAIGSIVTAIALVEQWSDPHGKPMVFGEFGAAPAQFTIVLTFLSIAITCSKLSVRSTLVACGMIALPAAIFAASVVRFAFVAMIASLALACLIAQSWRQRVPIAGLIATIFLSATAGLIARSETTTKFLRHETAVIAGSSASITPVTSAQAAATSIASRVAFNCPTVDTDNSVAIRKQLYADAFRLIPGAGLFGRGQDSFMVESCIKNTQVHNSLLQTIVEFGWLAGAILSMLFLLALRAARRASRSSQEAKFVLCGLFFVICMTMAHGHVSYDALLFLFLGYSAGLRELRVK